MSSAFKFNANESVLSYLWIYYDDTHPPERLFKQESGVIGLKQEPSYRHYELPLMCNRVKST